MASTIDGFFGDVIDGARGVFSDLLDYQIAKREVNYALAQRQDQQSHQNMQAPVEATGFNISNNVVILALGGVALVALFVALK